MTVIDGLKFFVMPLPYEGSSSEPITVTPLPYPILQYFILVSKSVVSGKKIKKGRKA